MRREPRVGGALEPRRGQGPAEATAGPAGVPETLRPQAAPARPRLPCREGARLRLCARRRAGPGFRAARPERAALGTVGRTCCTVRADRRRAETALRRGAGRFGPGHVDGQERTDAGLRLCARRGPGRGFWTWVRAGEAPSRTRWTARADRRRAETPARRRAGPGFGPGHAGRVRWAARGGERRGRRGGALAVFFPPYFLLSWLAGGWVVERWRKAKKRRQGQGIHSLWCGEGVGD